MSNTTLTRPKRTNADGTRGGTTAPPKTGEHGAYLTILVDPPWPTGQRNGPRNKGFGAERHYPLMSIEAIADLPINQLAAENAHLYMWCYPATRHIAEDLMRGFGFRFVDEFQWLKIPLGLGAYWRHSHETLILGVKGRLPVQFHGQPSWAIHPRQDHSHKPEEIHMMIERLSPGPRLELFARRPFPGWDVWGNEVESDIVIPGYPVPSDARHEVSHD